ncbi:hypothetical protein L6261_00085 [Candidatus Parcubacteria bacterium]|nr:hypothetical protein [Candidatus Parcubacteria bacterium]
MTPFFSFLKNKVFQKTKKWCHAREDGFSSGKSADEMPKAFRRCRFRVFLHLFRDLLRFVKILNLTNIKLQKTV